MRGGANGFASVAVGVRWYSLGTYATTFESLHHELSLRKGHDRENIIVKKTAVLALSALSASMFGQALGTWSEINWPNGYYVRAIHLVLLPDERMLLWNNSYSFGQPLPDTPRLTVVSPAINHAYDVFSVGGAANLTTNLFCVGHTLLEDGRLFAAGGHKIENGYGDDRINVFDWRNPNRSGSPAPT
jgi:hypothetical protein